MSWPNPLRLPPLIIFNGRGAELHDPDGDRVHCGTVLRIHVAGAWAWGRYEMGSRGDGYFVADDLCYSLYAVKMIEWKGDQS